ncbi:integrase, catalytic region, zinc finger, CCHC-type containing protein, partial [Tanacetum coccineum]
IQPADIDSDVGPSHDSVFLSEVQTPSTSNVNSLSTKDNQEQKYLKQPKIINDTFDDDQINSNITFDKPNVDVNSSSAEYDNNVQESYKLEKLARNAYKEAEKQQLIAKKVQQKDTVSTKQLESYKKKNPKLYDASYFDNLKIHVNVRDTEDILDDVTKSQIKMKDPIGLRAASSVRGTSNRDSSFKNSVLANTKKSSAKVEVSDRINKKSYVASRNVVLNTKSVIDIDVKNALKAKNVLCVSCAKNMLILCHDKCLANYKLNVHSKVKRALFTTPRIVKYMFEDTTHIVSKTMFSVKTTQSKSLDTTFIVSKPKIAAVTPLSAKNKLVQIILWIVDSGCSKHMTDDSGCSKFVAKFMGIVRFGNDHFSLITGYGDYVQGNITVCHVYYVEGLGHNLFSVGQFCDGDLEVAFRSKTCYMRNMEGDDLLTGARESNLYTISISDMAASSPVYLMSKATSTKSWLWHNRLSHLNFGTINDLTKYVLVDGLLKFKYGKDHLCSACEWGKSKKSSHPPKVVPSNHSKLELLHMYLCGPMRVASINGKDETLDIILDYSRFTWVYFLHIIYETLEIIKNFIARVQLNFNAKVHKIQTDNATEFKNATLKAHYDKLGIMKQFSIAHMP